ncbi:MAG TPA: aspartate aminotransferase family protein [Acidimicrobiales bacterium]|jgi:acetylornithine/succinyldiaminopimelate/putrescine aminotransferase|nr:aspartate aminotransferase family protein [Acidimicrobiales bacterium]
MSFDVAEVLRARHGENYTLHEKHLNHQLGRVLKTIGFDRFYVRGEGSYLFDAEGERYLDFLSGFGVYALGRSHPALKAALHQAIDLDLPNMVQMDCALLAGVLAEQLVARCAEEIDRVFFCNSGAEAIESAIKFSRQTTQRPRILFADHAFHGLTTGALSLNGGAEFREGFGHLLPGNESVPFGDIEALRRELKKGDVAAFIVEPIQGKGVYMATPEYWKEAQELCRRYKTLLVMDEVQTGLGRTGKFFCYEHYDLRPDIVTVSKALSGGYVPIGAVLMTEEVFTSVFSSLEKALKHSTTFGRNQLAMVAGLATLATFEDEHIVERAHETGLAFEAALAPLVERYEMFHSIRGKGLMIGLEFGPPKSAGLRMRFNALERIRPAIFSQMMVVPLFHRHRILTQVAADNVNIIKLLPPLICGQEEIDYFVNALDDVLGDAHSGTGLLFEFGRTMAKGALRKTGNARPDVPYQPPAQAVHGNGNGNGSVAQATASATA